MALSDLVALVITKLTTSPTRLGFGIPMIAAYHNVKPALTIPYKSLAAMKADGFAVTDPAYLAAAKQFSQNPRPSQVIIGRRTRAYVKLLHILPQKSVAGTVYSFTVVGSDGVPLDVEYTVPGSSSVAAICTALAALITGVTSVTATATATYVLLTGASGKLFDVQGLPGVDMVKVVDATVDPGVADDISDIFASDPKTWYAWTLDSSSPAEITAAAAWTETVRKLFIGTTSESAILDPASTTDLAYTLNAAGYARTALLFSKNSIQAYSAQAWQGCQLPKTPGSSTWMFKTLKTILPDLFLDSETGALEAKKCNYYSEVGGVNITQHGYTCAGESDFLDIVHGIDWLFARIQEAVFGQFANAEKVPFTNAGISTVTSLIDGVLRKGVKATLLASDPAPAVTAPDVKDVDPADKIARHLPGIEFTATLQGGVHSVDIAGTLQV